MRHDHEVIKHVNRVEKMTWNAECMAVGWKLQLSQGMQHKLADDLLKHPVLLAVSEDIMESMGGTKGGTYLYWVTLGGTVSWKGVSQCKVLEFPFPIKI